MALHALEVYRSKLKFGQGKNYVTPVCWVVPSKVKAIPSVCKTDAGSHGLVNSLVITNSATPNNPYYLYCTNTTAEIAALDD